MPGADTMGAGAGALVLAIIGGGGITTPITGITTLTTPIIGPTITPIIVTVNRALWCDSERLAFKNDRASQALSFFCCCVV